MKFFFWTLVLVSSLLFVSPVYSLYKIGIGIKEKDKGKTYLLNVNIKSYSNKEYSKSYKIY